MLTLVRLLACAVAGHEWEWGSVAPRQVTNAMDWARYLRSTKCRRCAQPWVDKNLKNSLLIEENWNV